MLQREIYEFIYKLNVNSDYPNRTPFIQKVQLRVQLLQFYLLVSQLSIIIITCYPPKYYPLNHFVVIIFSSLQLKSLFLFLLFVSSNMYESLCPCVTRANCDSSFHNYQQFSFLPVSEASFKNFEFEHGKAPSGVGKIIPTGLRKITRTIREILVPCHEVLITQLTTFYLA